jgi:peptide/nickel transport system ATP-binding protein
MLIDVKDLAVHFRTEKKMIKAVDGVSFTIPHGKTLCLVGESGCGKSVTSMAILGLVDHPGEVVNGEINFDGRNILECTEKEMRSVRGADISMIFQDAMTSLNPCFTVDFQLKEVLKLHQNLKKNALHEKAIEALELVAIPSPEKRLKEYPFKMSGGMRQRVMIALAMACQPKLLIADEPTTALDVTIQAQVLALMNKLKEERNTSILFITHDLAVVSEMADHVAVMYTGRIVEKTDCISLFKKPMHPYTEGLLRSLPSENKGRRKSKLHSIEGSVPSLSALPLGCTFWPRCPYASEICKKEQPLLKECESGHFVACFKLEGVI